MIKHNLSEDDTGAALMAFINGELFPGLKELPATGKWASRARVVKAVFEDAYNCMKDGQLIRQMTDGDPAAAAEQLKTVIRVTLPTEAALVDVAPHLGVSSPSTIETVELLGTNRS